MDATRDACQRMAPEAQHEAQMRMAAVMSQGMCDIG